MRYLMTFSYDGSNYNGYQKQPNVNTIQSEIENKLKQINSNKQVDIHASGRTDAKVHALNQKAHFDLDIDISPENLKKALNSLINKDIYIKDIIEVNDEFHARFNVKSKEYMYIINIGEYNPIEKDYVYQYNKKLNIEEMKKALNYLEGTHNFKSFTKAEVEKETNDFVRTIIKTNLLIENDKITISFLGTGFMRYMVRNMVGTLIEIGEGKRKSEDIINILEEEDRKKAGKTANPEGLYLKDVFY